MLGLSKNWQRRLGLTRVKTKTKTRMRRRTTTKTGMMSLRAMPPKEKMRRMTTMMTWKFL